MYSNENYAEEGYDDYGYDNGMVEDGMYDRSYYPMHEDVKKFLVYFCSVIKGGVVYEIQNLYENTFPKLSEQHFEKKAWPSEDEVAHLVDNDSLFMILYKELYYRHLHARIQGGTLVQIYHWIRVKSDYQVVAISLDLFQKVQMSHMEKIECTGNVYNLVRWFGRCTVAELNYLLRRWQELRTTGPWTPRRMVLSQFG